MVITEVLTGRSSEIFTTTRTIDTVLDDVPAPPLTTEVVVDDKDPGKWVTRTRTRSEDGEGKIGIKVTRTVCSGGAGGEEQCSGVVTTVTPTFITAGETYPRVRVGVERGARLGGWWCRWSGRG